MKSLFDKIIFGKDIIGIEVFTIAEKNNYALTRTTKKKNEILISQNELLDSLDLVLQQKVTTPVALTINNRQVLQKQVDSIDKSDKKLLHQAFPNINQDDFHFEIVRFKQSSVVAVCRKSYIDQLLSSLKNFKVFNISLGICAVGSVLDFDLPETLSTNTQTFTIQGSYNPNSDLKANYTVNDLLIGNQYLLSFCSTIRIFLKSPGTSGSISQINESLTEENSQQIFFTKGIKSGLILVFGILIINFLVFSYYFNKSEGSNETIALNKVSIENIVKTRERIKVKEQKVEDIASQSLSRSSYIINEIAKGLPVSVLLEHINYYPLEKKIKDNESISFVENTILISGTTIDNESFTLWVSQLEKTVWTNKVTILSFGKNRENKTGFELMIEIGK